MSHVFNLWWHIHSMLFDHRAEEAGIPPLGSKHFRLLLAAWSFSCSSLALGTAVSGLNHDPWLGRGFLYICIMQVLLSVSAWCACSCVYPQLVCGQIHHHFCGFLVWSRDHVALSLHHFGFWHGYPYVHIWVNLPNKHSRKFTHCLPLSHPLQLPSA